MSTKLPMHRTPAPPSFAGMKVGNLARRAGVTVRTLHHYDRIGLVCPSLRTAAGHRLYAATDLRRLTAVVMLRGMGFPLREIRDLLSPRRADDRRPQALPPPSPAHLRALITRRAATLGEQIARLRDAHARLEGLLRLMHSTHSFSVDNCLTLLETLAMTQPYYTPEQLEELKQRRDSLGPDAIAAAEKEWPDLMARMKAECDAGTDPAHPRVQALARRWKQLVESFTGGNPAIAQSLNRMWKEKGPDLAQQHKLPFSPELLEFVRRAQATMRT